MRKRRIAKQQVLPLPSPAWVYELLAGQDPQCRLTGWVQQAQAGQFGELTADQVWEQHQDGLIDEAEAHGFEPFWLHKRRPVGDGFARWRERFLEAHQY